MERNENKVHYRLRPTETGVRLTVIDPKDDILAERTLLEGLEFDNVPDALRFIGVHYPNAKEID